MTVAGQRNPPHVQAVRRYIEYLLKDRTDSAKFIADPLTFERVNDDMLRANFLKSKGDALCDAIWRLPEAGGIDRIDVSGGRSRFELPSGVGEQARGRLAEARRQLARMIGKPEFAEAVLDPEYFHYLDLCLCGFEALRPMLSDGLGFGPDDLRAAEVNHHAPSRQRAKATLERRLREHVRALQGPRSDDCALGIVAGSSVYLAAFVLETIMRPGSVLLVPEFTFYGTLNCILPLFRNLPQAPDCSVALIATSPRNGYKLTAGDLRRTLRNLTAAGRRPGALWLTCPTNLGAGYRPAELDEIAAVVAAAELPVVSDEIFSGLGNFDRHLSPMRDGAFGERLIILNTSSKYFNFYDGDHLLHSELADQDGVLTEDVNTWSGGISYYVTANGAWRDEIDRHMSRHPFTLTRLLFAMSVVEGLPPELAVARSRAYEADCTTVLKELVGYAEIGRGVASGPGLRPRILVRPDAGYSLGIAIPSAAAASAGIADAAQLAGYLAATQALRTDVVSGAADPALIALRFNYSQDAEVLREAAARLGVGLAELASRGDYLAALPRQVLDLAMDTQHSRRARFLSGTTADEGRD